MNRFVLNDETRINSHGFYLINSGGRFERFDENPVMLDCHDLKVLLGEWKNRAIEGSLLTAEPVFDSKNSHASEREGQVQRGFLRGASCGIIIKRAEYRLNAVSQSEELYVTDWELLEASIVTVPSNAGALTLKVYNDSREPIADNEVSLHIGKIIQLSINQLTKDREMEKITLTTAALSAIGLNANCSAEAISEAVLVLKTKLEATQSELAELKKKEAEMQEKRAIELVDLAIDRGSATKEARESLLAYAKTDYEGASKFLSASQAKPSITEKIKRVSLGSDRDSWTFFDWKKNDPQTLEHLRVNDRTQYEQIIKNRK